MEENRATAEPLSVCEGCGATAPTAADPYCEVCGRRMRNAAVDHVEMVADEALAGVSDRGLRHRENQDRMGLQRLDGGALAVVCDGVSRSHRPEQAAALVVEAVMERAAAWNDAHAAVEEDAGQMLRGAVSLAIGRLREGEACSGECAATTVVAAVLHASQLRVLWIGDSRAYWMEDGGALRQLTVDHTLNDASSAEADGPVSHVLTRWLAADAGRYAEPEVVELSVRGPGVLLLCSDGLWNYAAREAEMQALVGAALESTGSTAASVARDLVGAALARGGDDNVSVVVLRVPAEAVPPGE